MFHDLNRTPSLELNVCVAALVGRLANDNLHVARAS